MLEERKNEKGSGHPGSPNVGGDSMKKKKKVTRWVAEDAERLCERLDGHFERMRGEIYIVYEEDEK